MRGPLYHVFTADLKIVYFNLPGERTDYVEPESRRHVVAFLSTFLRMFETPEAREAMEEMAAEYLQWQRVTRNIDNLRDPSRIVEEYLVSIHQSFPVICVDETIYNKFKATRTRRRPWSETFFKGADHTASINAWMFFHMIDFDMYSQQYKTWQFIFASALLREIGGHLLMHFLKGRDEPRATTPPPITSVIQAALTNDPSRGDAGRKFECAMFGGHIDYFRDPNENTGKAMVPYMVLPDPREYPKCVGYRIDQRTIENIINWSECISNDCMRTTLRQYR
ncbi:hypothetical protein ACLMJK_009587 [Lecanora helva]